MGPELSYSSKMLPASQCISINNRITWCTITAQSQGPFVFCITKLLGFFNLKPARTTLLFCWFWWPLWTKRRWWWNKVNFVLVPADSFSPLCHFKKITLQVLKEFFKKKKKTRGEKRPPVWASASWLVQPLSYPRSSAVPWQDKHNNQDRGVSWRAQRSSGNNSLIVPLRYSDSRHTQVWAHTSGFREQAAED